MCYFAITLDRKQVHVALKHLEINYEIICQPYSTTTAYLLQWVTRNVQMSTE